MSGPPIRTPYQAEAFLAYAAKVALKGLNMKNKKIVHPELIPVVSTTLSGMAYEPGQKGTGVLFITFISSPGWLYVYQNVPAKLYALLQSVGEANTVLMAQDANPVSLGSLFHYCCKIHPDKYPFEKMQIEVDDGE